MNERLVLVVSLWLRDGDVVAFESFERQGARLLSKHGGRVERAIRLANSGDDSSVPFEIHIVTFPDQRSLTAYRTDAEVQSLAAEREGIIAKTLVLEGCDVDVY
jgi:hypothetical protein